MFEVISKPYDTKTLYHRNDPISSKVVAEATPKFRVSHEDKIRALLKEHGEQTSKQLELLSRGTPNEITHLQIDRRVFQMPDVVRGKTLMPDGCCGLRLK